MAWIKLDDQFSDHPKIVAVGPLAAWLYVCGLVYCGRYLTDGFIPLGQVRKLADVDNPSELVAKLVAIGLWDAIEDGYIVHDYLEYNPTAEEVKAVRNERSKAGRKGGIASGESKRKAKAKANALANAEAKRKQNQTPSPSPFPLNTNTSTKAGKTPATPVTCADWQKGFRTSKNQVGYVGDMLKALYPYYADNKPNHGFIGKLLKAHDPDYMLSLIWQNAARPPAGDPVRYIAGILSKNKPPPEKPDPEAQRQAQEILKRVNSR